MASATKPQAGDPAGPTIWESAVRGSHPTAPLSRPARLHPAMMPARACWRRAGRPARSGLGAARHTTPNPLPQAPHAGRVPEDAWEHHIRCAAAQGRGGQQLRAPRDAASVSGAAAPPPPAESESEGGLRSRAPPLLRRTTRRQQIPAARCFRHRRRHRRHRPPCCARPPLRRRSLNDAAYQGLEYVPYCSTMPVPKACEQPRFMWVGGGGELPARCPGAALPVLLY
jgi:hypothetical protein